jgi:hypothetical protein
MIVLFHARRLRQTRQGTPRRRLVAIDIEFEPVGIHGPPSDLLHALKPPLGGPNRARLVPRAADINDAFHASVRMPGVVANVLNEADPVMRHRPDHFLQSRKNLAEPEEGNLT